MSMSSLPDSNEHNGLAVSSQKPAESYYTQSLNGPNYPVQTRSDVSSLISRDISQERGS